MGKAFGSHVPDDVETDETDMEFARVIPHGDLGIVCEGNPRRIRQLARWHVGVNRGLKQRLVLTRRRWYEVIYKLMWGREYRRHKLLMLLSQQHKMRMAFAFAWITTRVLRPKF